MGRARGVAASEGTALAGRPGLQTGQAAIGRRDERTNEAASAVREQAAFAVQELRPRGKKRDLLSGGLSMPELGRWSEVWHCSRKMLQWLLG